MLPVTGTPSYVFGQSIAVFFVLGLLAATLYLLRRRGMTTFSLPSVRATKRQKLMQVIERVPLTPHHSLHLVRVQDRVLLIGVSPSGCNQLEAFSQEALQTSAAAGGVA